MITEGSLMKAHNIRRDSRVAVCISTDQEPYKYVLLEGTAEVSNRDVEMITYSVCTRYRGQESGSRLAEALVKGGDAVILIVRPTKVITWLDG